MQKCKKLCFMRKGTARQSLCGKRAAGTQRRKMIPDAGKEGRIQIPWDLWSKWRMFSLSIGEREWHAVCRINYHITFTCICILGLYCKDSHREVVSSPSRAAPRLLIFSRLNLFYYHICVCYAQEKTHFPRTFWRKQLGFISLTYRGIEGFMLAFCV